MSHLLCRYHVLALISQASLACSPHRCNWGHRCSCDHRCRWDSFAENQRWQQLLRSTEGSSRPIPAYSRTSEKWFHQIKRHFCSQVRATFCRSTWKLWSCSSIARKKVKLDGHTQKRPLLGRAHKIPETNLNPQRIIKKWSGLVVLPMKSLPCSFACSLSLARSLAKTQGQYHTAKHIFYLWTSYPYLRSLSHAFTFHTLNSCSAALCHAASFKRLWCPYPCMGRGVIAKRENAIVT